MYDEQHRKQQWRMMTLSFLSYRLRNTLYLSLNTGRWVRLLLLMLSAPVLAEPQLLLFYESTHDLTPQDDTYWVEVYQDGTALVHYPIYMKKAGDYVVRLSPAEVQQIRVALEHPLVKGFNAQQINQQKKALDAQSVVLSHISDNSYANFEIPNSDAATGERQQIRWANLQSDAANYPGIGVSRKLADIEARLLDLGQHPTAVRAE